MPNCFLTSTVHLVVLLVVILVFGFAPMAHAQGPTLCGVPIPAAAELIKQRVETGFGKAIHCQTARGLQAKAGADVGPGEQPIILLDAERGSNTLAITHELLHLQLHLEGFQINGRWVPPASTPAAFSVARALRFEALLYDELQHHLIAPKLRAMGLDINAAFVPQVVQLIQSDGVQNPPEQAIVNMLRLDDNGDHAVLMRYESWLKRAGYLAEEKLGERVLHDVRTGSFTTTDSAMQFCRKVDHLVMAHVSNYSREGSER